MRRTSPETVACGTGVQTTIGNTGVVIAIYNKFAKAIGCKVTATASTAKYDVVKRLGADVVSRCPSLPTITII